MKNLRIFALLMFVLLFFGACKKSEKINQEASKAKSFGKHSCGACSMIVREQSVSRGQVVHRNGKRLFFCSISDMLSYLEAPSPHGSAIKIYVEAQNPKDNPKQFITKEHPWLDATQAHYVLGVQKPRVMGVPVLVYKKQEEAKQISKSYKAKAYTWQTLKPAWKALRNH